MLTMFHDVMRTIGELVASFQQISRGQSFGHVHMPFLVVCLAVLPVLLDVDPVAFSM